MELVWMLEMRKRMLSNLNAQSDYYRICRIVIYQIWRIVFSISVPIEIFLSIENDAARWPWPWAQVMLLLMMVCRVSHSNSECKCWIFNIFTFSERKLTAARAQNDPSNNMRQEQIYCSCDINLNLLRTYCDSRNRDNEYERHLGTWFILAMCTS